MFAYPLTSDAELRLLEPRHAEALYALVDANRAFLRRWLPWVETTVSVDDSRQFIRESLERLARSGDIVAGIWYHSQLAGVIDVCDINQSSGRAEIGYWLAEVHQGKGLMTLACKAVLNHAFGTLGLNRVQIRVEPANTRSAAIPRRLGFRHEGTLRQVGKARGRLIDLNIYSLLKNEWKAQP